MPEKKQRRRPSQSRSRALVDAILEGARQNLAQVERLGELTTKRIAKRAGVSIGSLYQYFADKDAIFATLIGRELRIQEKTFAEAVEAARSMDEAIERAVAEAERLYARTPHLSRLFLHAVRLGATQDVVDTRRRVASTLASSLRRFGDFVEPLEAEIELLIHAIMGVFEAATLAPGSVVVDDPRRSIERLVKASVSALLVPA